MAGEDFYAGVEGGASNTTLVILNAAGSVVATETGPGTNGWVSLGSWANMRLTAVRLHPLVGLKRFESSRILRCGSTLAEAAWEWAWGGGGGCGSSA
jgi:hypothetical protein